MVMHKLSFVGRLRLKCDGTRAETRFRLSAKRTSPFKSTGASVKSTTGSRGVRISGSNAGYTMFRGSVKSTGYPLHSPVSPSLSLPASPCAIRFHLDSNEGIAELGEETRLEHTSACALLWFLVIQSYIIIIIIIIIICFILVPP
jgi:hypothetical protein